MTVGDGRPSGGGQPATLTELVEALAVLPSLDPADQARLCPILDKATTVILHEVRVAAVCKGTETMSQAEFGRRAEMTRQKVSDYLTGRR